MADMKFAGNSDAYRKANALFGLDVDQLQKAKDLGFDFSKSSPLDMALVNRVLNLDETTDRILDKQSQRRLQEAKAAQLLGKESLAETAKYKLLLDLPAQITTAYALPGAIEAQGAANVAGIMAEAGAAIPDLVSYQRAPYAYTPIRYF
jgi:hypothetical protein